MDVDQLCLFRDNPEYDAFVEKFTPKKTTDDCYTPPLVYDAVKNWACAEYGIAPDSIVRPFYPGGDFENFKYPRGCTVLDNPPFSILSRICRFYLERGISFFLFAPGLTAFSAGDIVTRLNHVICDAAITYDNGAVVNTSFVTNYEKDIVAQTSPSLGKAISEAMARIKGEAKRTIPKYDYPDHVLTAAMMQRYSKRGVEFKVHRGECVAISALDAQKKQKKIFGGGLLLSERAAAEKAAAEKAAAEKAADRTWKLSARECKIIKSLGERMDGADNG